MQAIVAVAASMLTAAYSMLRGDQDRLVAGLTRRLHRLGYEVTLRPAT